MFSCVPSGSLLLVVHCGFVYSSQRFNQVNLVFLVCSFVRLFPIISNDFYFTSLVVFGLLLQLLGLLPLHVGPDSVLLIS